MQTAESAATAEAANDDKTTCDAMAEAVRDAGAQASEEAMVPPPKHARRPQPFRSPHTTLETAWHP